jgi:hypothetical protein
MTRHQARAARRERQAARALGTRRVVRERGESAPDALPARLPSGAVLQLEVKERAAPLRVVSRWFEQCRGYAAPGALPVLVVFATGQHADDALVVVRLADFRRAVGLEAQSSQPALPFGRAV